MTEETEGQDTGAEAVVGGVDAAAVALALNGASQKTADAFLNDQRALIADQRHHLHEQFKQLRLGIWEKRLGVLLRVATVVVGIGFAAGIGLMVWDAAHSEGLVIEPFSVPPDLAVRGLTGQAVASQVLDDLTALQNRTQSARPPQSYANNWGSDLKVEIPETGVSVGELQRFLRDWLGHDTHITGEFRRTATGITITARAGSESGEAVSGPESDFDGLVQEAAENVYRVTQPYRYANYLDRFYIDKNAYPADWQARVAKADAIYRQLIYDPNPIERAWAWNGLGTEAWVAHGDVPGAIDYYHKALAVRPDFGTALSALASWMRLYGHMEESLAVARHYVEVLPNNNLAHIYLAFTVSDFPDMLRAAKSQLENARSNPSLNFNSFADRALAGLHEGRQAHTFGPETSAAITPFARTMNDETVLIVQASLGNWQAVVAQEPLMEHVIRDTMPGFDFKTEFDRILRPQLALAKAHLGDLSGAQILIAMTPADCYGCVQIRGLIASQAKQYGRADYWFARAVELAPSIPMAYADWGQSFLARGKPDEAIVRFNLANQKGPHFADPLEGWGEALMAKNQAHLAVAKFAEADKYAPHWGRLHMKWGEALGYAGKKDDARAEYQKASMLDLTAAEKAELARQALHV